MKPQLQYSRKRRDANVDVDINTLTLEELRAYIAGLEERRRVIIAAQCDGTRCSRCSHRQSCDQRLTIG
jgi:hypothetical protein